MARHNLLRTFGPSRRAFLRGGGALAIGAALPARARAARENELNIYGWDGHKSGLVLDPFRSEFECEVRAEGLTSDPDAVNRLRGGETVIWDLVNLNNPWARAWLYPEGLIVPLERARFEPYYERMLPRFRPPYRWAVSEDGGELLGMAQRFGPFSFVVNTNKISRRLAEDQGFELFLDAAMAGRYGLLAYENWNIYHMCITAGFSPFRPHTEGEMERFAATARGVFRNAALVSDDHRLLNHAMISGEIDACFTGGTYTASPFRLAGLTNIRGITPARGPIDGKGGIVWIELTSAVNNPQLSPRAYDFLDYVQRPEVSRLVAFAEETFNPVTQMGNPEVLALFDAAELDAIQWDSLEEEMARSVDYDINPDHEAMLALYNAAKRERG
jgi:spermidine/putrescine transport system substrate-binding protein